MSKAQASVYCSNGKHKNSLIEQVRADRSINPRNAHWQKAEDWQKAELILVPDEGCSINDVTFSDQTPLWHTHNVMLSTIVGKNENQREDINKTVMYFSEWEK